MDSTVKIPTIEAVKTLGCLNDRICLSCISCITCTGYLTFDYMYCKKTSPATTNT